MMMHAVSVSDVMASIRDSLDGWFQPVSVEDIVNDVVYWLLED